jgi:hypothetical protein
MFISPPGPPGINTVAHGWPALSFSVNSTRPVVDQGTANAIDSPVG